MGRPITNVSNMTGMSKKNLIFFQQKVNKTMFLNNEETNNEEKTNCHAIDQTCVTCIPSESSSKIISTHSHFILHLAFNFQRRNVVNEKGSANLTGFKSFPACIMRLGWLVV